MTRRVPVMRPAARGGLAAGAALTEQVRVTLDGVVEVVGGRTEQRLPSGTVHRAVLLADADAERLLHTDNHHQGGALLLLDAAGAPLLALLVLDWAPPGSPDLTALRAATGVDAVCAALGLPLEPAEAADLDALARHSGALRAVLHSPGPRPRLPRRAAWRTAWAAVLLSIFTLLGASASDGGANPVGDVLGGAHGGVLGLLAAVLALCVGVPTVLASLALHRVTRAPAPGLDADPVVLRASPATAVPARVVGHELQVTPDLLLLRRYGAVVVLPGPQAGGVAQAVLEPSAVRLRDADGLLYASLCADLWCGSPAARDALREGLQSAGLEVLDAPVDAFAPLDLVEQTTDGAIAQLVGRPQDRGGVVAGPGRLVALATGAAAAAAGAAYQSGADWQDAPAVVLGVACAVLTVVLTVQLLLAARVRRADAVLVQPGARGVAAR
ncbi:MAG: hypothetical protein JWN08_3591 [Frankiales bacterium]|nr:hypothetical protein [Frankiales bacterium]